MAAAERAGKPMLVAAGAFRLVFVFISARHYAQAEETGRTAADALWHRADEGTPEAMSLWGGRAVTRDGLAAQLRGGGYPVRNASLSLICRLSRGTRRRVGSLVPVQVVRVAADSAAEGDRQ
jgi:hypothetical protein